jgi:hypothetical protein
MALLAIGFTHQPIHASKTVNFWGRKLKILSNKKDQQNTTTNNKVQFKKLQPLLELD